MLFKNLFVDFPFPIPENIPDVEITGIAIDSRAVKPGYLFVAMKGGYVDGHDYIQKAIENGAVAIIGDVGFVRTQHPLHSTRKPASSPDLVGCCVLQLACPQADSDRRNRHRRQNHHEQSYL